MADSDTTTIRGIVIPTAWNASGKVTSVAVATYQEEKIPVVDTPAGRRLLDLLQERVVVDGTLREEGGRISIEVQQVCIDASPIA